MKSISLYAHDDDGMESRLQAALDVARMQNGHVECVTAKPLTALMMSDPFGASFIVPEVLESIDNEAEAAQARMAARMTKEDVAWSLFEGDGEPAEILAARARFADLVVLSLGQSDSSGDLPPMLIGDVVMNSNVPILAVPNDLDRIIYDGIAVVAWNGTVEAANAMRAAVPLLVKAKAVHIVTVTDDDDAITYPQTDAAAYLSRHGITPEIHLIPRDGKSVKDALKVAVDDIKADWMVMGAYGHSRLRELLFGGVTRNFLSNSSIPILIAH